MNAKNTDPIVPIKTLAKQLGVSCSTVRREVDRGRIPKPIELSKRRRGWRLNATLREVEQRRSRINEDGDKDASEPAASADATDDGDR